MPKFSLIIPVYNVASYLKFCLDSVLNQVFTDYECILIDDGSTDESSKICDDYSLKDNRIKVIHKKNGGPSDARNAGISSSTGLYIVFLDGDDYLFTENALLDLSNVILKTKAPVIFNSKLITFKDNENIFNSLDLFYGSNESYTPIVFYKTLMRTNNVLFAVCLFTVHRDFLLKNNLFFKSGILHEDELWAAFIVCKAEKIAINHNHFYCYRKNRENSTMSGLNPKRLFDMQIIIDDLKSNKNQLSKNVRFIIDERCIILWHTVFDSVFLLEEKYTNEKIMIIQKLNKQKKILLNRIKIKNYIYFLLLFFLGVQNVYTLKEKIKKYLKRPNLLNYKENQ
jgi:glycosyltransferase involved in cell wall biosynthesis